MKSYKEVISGINEEDKIDWKKVKASVMNAAEDIFDKVDKKKVDGIVDGISKKKPKDTEDAIEIGVDMLRSK